MVRYCWTVIISADSDKRDIITNQISIENKNNLFITIYLVGARIESMNDGYFFGTRKSMRYENDNIYTTKRDVDIISFKITSPGLSGELDTVSFQSIEDGRYVTVATRDGVLELKKMGELSGGEAHFEKAASFRYLEDKFFDVTCFIYHTLIFHSFFIQNR